MCTSNCSDPSDFLVSTTFVDLRNDNRRVGITLRRDSLSLERDELLQLKLSPTPNFDKMNEFVVESLNITIIDNDGKTLTLIFFVTVEILAIFFLKFIIVVSVFFAEIDFSLSPEDAQNLTVQIVRSTAIARSLSVVVYPLNNTYVNQTRDASIPTMIFEGEPLQIPDEIVIPDRDDIRPTVATSKLNSSLHSGE